MWSFMLVLSCVFAVADSQMPYSCTGHFQTDFAELCHRIEPPFVYTPAIILRPRRPRSPTGMPVIEEKPSTKTSKSSKKEEHDKIETPMSLEKGGCNQCCIHTCFLNITTIN